MLLQLPMKTNGIRHVIWDFNGTLVDDFPASLAAINRLLEKRGLRRLTRRTYRDIFGFPVRDCYVRMGFDFQKEDWDAVAREFHDQYLAEARTAPLRKGVVSVLEVLVARGKTLSVLSASEIGILRGMLAERGIENFFRNICGITDLHGASKLERGRELMEDMGLSPDQVLLVGDTTHDHDVARDLKCRCVLLRGGHQAEKRLRQSGCPVIRRVSEVLALAP